jgi:hypothetical protein
MEENLKSYYCLRIGVNKKHYNQVTTILGVNNQEEDDGLFDETWWTYNIEVKKYAPEDCIEYNSKGEITYMPENYVQPINYLHQLLLLLKGKYEQLKEIGVERKDISIWMLYAYDGQCNMEFAPEDMYALGKEGIALCISCWDIHDYDADEYNENGELRIQD